MYMPVQVLEGSCIATEKSLINECVLEFLLFNRSLWFVTFIFLLALDTAIKLRLINNILRLPSFSLAVAVVGVIQLYLFVLGGNGLSLCVCCRAVCGHMQYVSVLGRIHDDYFLF
jgi:hypothetical protein